MIRESTENYLETIYILSQRMKDVRSIDVCNELGYSKPTISVAMKQFREKKLIEMDGSGYILADESTRTSVPGVFAVGDVRTKQLRQIVTAAADGAVAVHYAVEYLAEA